MLMEDRETSIVEDGVQISSNSSESVDIDKTINLDFDCENRTSFDSEKSDNVIKTDVEEESLVGLTVYSEKEAYILYNSYAYRKGFSVRKSRQRRKCKGEKRVTMKEFVCQKQGKKINRIDKCYSKLDVRTGCEARIQFVVNDDGIWTVTKHDRNHNHEMCPETQRHLLRSHRTMTKSNVNYFLDLKKSEVSVSSGFKLLKNQAGGSPVLGSTSKDAYNSLAAVKLNQFEGEDTNALLDIFRRRKATELDFFYDFEMDSNSTLCSFFWQDGQMKQYYDLFGDFLSLDTTYRVNKYGMICVPFFGMNHHSQNIMFGCGFLATERTESFVWLFESFLNSKGGKQPITVMTDQCAAMAPAIRQVFFNSRHRLCIWRIGECMKNDLRGMMQRDGFVDDFNSLLNWTHTEVDFEFHWNRVMDKYGCHNEPWLQKLYDMKEKWCPSFNKEYFSGGVLSSQRSESTNRSLSKRLTKTASLCDFYYIFLGVIAEWRDKEDEEELRCKKGRCPIVVQNSKLLNHANEVYTIQAYRLFEEEFLKFGSLVHELVDSSGKGYLYRVWCEDIDASRHVVVFHQDSLNISCTCKRYSEVGFLCSHCIRIFNLHRVQNIPEQYISKRWRRDYVQTSVSRTAAVQNSYGEHNVAASLWRTEMIGKFSLLISACATNKKAREIIDQGLKTLRARLVAEVGPICFYDSEDDDDDELCRSVRDPDLKRARVK